MPTTADAPLADPARLAALAATGLFECGTDPAFDRLARVARRALGASFGFASLVGARRQVVKGRDGTDFDEGLVAEAICHRTVARAAPLAIPDTAADPLCDGLPAVRDGVRAYLGVPVRGEGGAVVGTVAVCDAAPRAWTDDDVALLEDLAATVSAEIAARATARGRDVRRQEARDHSEALFRALFDTVSQLTGLLAPDGTVVEANQTALRFAGLPREDVVGRPLWETLSVSEGVERRHRDAVARAAEGETVRYEETVWDARGAERVLDVTLKPALGEAGLLLLEGRDVTGAVQVRRLQIAMMAGLAGTWDLDLHTDAVRVSGGTDLLFGLDADAGPHPLGAYFERIHPDDVERVRAALGAAAERGGGYEAECRVVHAGGAVRWIRARGTVTTDDDGRPERIVGAVADVTEQRREAEAAARAATDLQTALDAAQMGRWEVDLETGEIFRDDRAREIHGVPATPPRLLVAEAVDVQVHPDDRPRAEAVYAEALANGESFEIEYRPAVASGRWVRVTGRVLRETRRVVGVAQDVTAEREVEEALRASAARAAFRSALADALRPLSDPVEIQAEAARVLGDHFGVARAFYAEIEPDGEYIVVHRDHCDGVPSVAGRHRIADFGRAVAEAHREGRTLVVDDVAAEPDLSADERAAYAAIDVRAHLDVTLVYEGRLAAVLALHHPAPQTWTPEEVALVEETAERTRAAVEQARAEAALRESEERLGFALDVAGLGQWDLDLETGAAFRSSRHDAIFGYPAPLASWTYDEFLEHVVPDDRDRVDRAFQEARAGGGTWAFECGIRRADGSQGWIAVRGRVWLTDGGEPRRMVGTVADVTPQRRAEAALRESEERYRTLFESVTVGFAVIDLVRDRDGTAVDYRYVEVNPTFSDQTGLEDVEGRLVSEFIPDLEPHWPELFGRVATTGRPARRLDYVAGLGRWFDVYAARVGGAGSGRVGILFNDVTEQKEAERAVRASEARFRGTFENAAVGIAHVGLDGAWLDVNERLCEIVGYSHDELLGLTFRDITHPDDLGADQEQFERLLAGEVGHYQLEKRYVHRDGHTVWINLTVAPNWASDGEVDYVISVVEDVSEKKAAEAALRALNDGLEDRVRERTAELARSNAELDQFAYVASHDLKAPIRAIDSLATWIDEDAGDALPDGSARHLALLRQRAKRMERLLDSLLAYSRAGRSEAAPEPVDTAALARDVAETVAPPGGFDVRVEGDFPVVETARAPLALVLRNLVGNAIKHHDRPDGRVTVSARDVPPHPRGPRATAPPPATAPGGGVPPPGRGGPSSRSRTTGRAWRPSTATACSGCSRRSARATRSRGAGWGWPSLKKRSRAGAGRSRSRGGTPEVLGSGLPGRSRPAPPLRANPWKSTASPSSSSKTTSSTPRPSSARSGSTGSPTRSSSSATGSRRSPRCGPSRGRASSPSPTWSSSTSTCRG